jgi:hypothetical protein
MTDTPTQFGIPNTLPPLGRREMKGCFVFAAMGLLGLLVGLFPHLRPPPRMALPLALCCLAFPAWGLRRFITRKAHADVQAREERTHGTSTQVRFFAVIMIGIGVSFYFWARHLGAPSPVILGSLLIIEGLGGMIVSLTEWWRLSHIGVSSGLVAGGFLLPLAGNISVAVPAGGAFLLGSLLSAGILYWQLRYLPVEPSASPNGGPTTQLGSSRVTEGPPSVS